MYAEAFPSRLKKARKRTGFSQLEVAKEIDITRDQLANYETGRTQPDLETLGALAEFCQVSTDWLLGLEMNEPSPNTDKLKEKQIRTYLDYKYK